MAATPNHKPTRRYTSFFSFFFDKSKGGIPPPGWYIDDWLWNSHLITNTLWILLVLRVQCASYYKAPKEAKCQSSCYLAVDEHPIGKLHVCVSWSTDNTTTKRLNSATSIPTRVVKLRVNSDRWQSWLHCLRSTSGTQLTPANAQWGEESSTKGGPAKRSTRRSKRGDHGLVTGIWWDMAIKYHGEWQS